jgi:GTPase
VTGSPGETKDGAPTRCGFVAVIGAPNAGKSTLVNQLVGGKISIVSHKVQTTRARIRAITIEGASQVVFVDTPGIFLPKRRLDEAMVQAAWSSAGDADVIVLVVDARRGRDEEVDRILEGTAAVRTPVVLVLNKIDTIERPTLLDLATELHARGRFDATFMVSALTGDGVADLRRDLAGRMPEGPWLYPEDQIADVPLRLLAS